MKKIKHKPIMFTSIIVMMTIWGFIWAQKRTDIFQSFELYLFLAIIFFGVVALVIAFRKEKEIKSGFAVDDELSDRIKHKAGYYAYLSSMYMWLLIFIFHYKFPDVETMLGGGILLSAALSLIARYIVKRQFDE
jgi:hypothetical protein